MAKFQVTQRTDTLVPHRGREVQFDHMVLIRDLLSGVLLTLTREEAHDLVMQIENATDRIADKEATLARANKAMDAIRKANDIASKCFVLSDKADRAHADCEAGLPRKLANEEQIPF